MKEKCLICCDLKSFYASVECVERGLDPMITNLVVADERRTDKTICLAVPPSLKDYGIPGRARLFEVVQKVKEVNARRLQRAPGRRFTGASCGAPRSCGKTAPWPWTTSWPRPSWPPLPRPPMTCKRRRPPEGTGRSSWTCSPTMQPGRRGSRRTRRSPWRMWWRWRAASSEHSYS